MDYNIAWRLMQIITWIFNDPIQSIVRFFIDNVLHNQWLARGRMKVSIFINKLIDKIFVHTVESMELLFLLELECTHFCPLFFFIVIQFLCIDPSSLFFPPRRMSISCSIWSCIHKRYDWQLCASKMFHSHCVYPLDTKIKLFNLTLLECWNELGVYI